MDDYQKLTDDMIKEVLLTEKKLTLFIRAHLYLEHFLDLAVEKYFPKQKSLLSVPYFSTDLKLRILHGNGFLTDVIYLNGKMMNEIRNRFAHTLNPNQDKLRHKISNMVLPWEPEQKIESMDAFERYQSVAIRVITAIKNALEQNRVTNLYPEMAIPDNQK